MYAWLNVVPAWRRYLQYARSTTTSRHDSPARSVNRLKPSFSASPRHTRANVSWKISLTSSVSRSPAS